MGVGQGGSADTQPAKAALGQGVDVLGPSWVEAQGSRAESHPQAKGLSRREQQEMDTVARSGPVTCLESDSASCTVSVSSPPPSRAPQQPLRQPPADFSPMATG